MEIQDREEAQRLIKELERRRSRNLIDAFYPDGPNRLKYPVHMEFFRQGRKVRERLMLAANRVGKTQGVLCYEVALHLTGMYPEWWAGRRFDRPVKAWLGGDTSTTVRDILQQKLLGDLGNPGTGILRGDCILDTTNKRGVPDAVENIIVRHVSGGKSVVQLKSYDQGREAWQGTEQDIIGLDEEPPADIYSEAVIRTMTTGGMVLSTYTPMKGMTEVTEGFLSVDKPESKWYCTATWDDVGHLDEKTKKELWDSVPIHEREARSKGIPTIGTGKIYPVDLGALLIDPFDLPKHWVKGYGMDVGWNRTAAIWGALDRDSDTLYLYSEHYVGQAEPAVHASSIKARGQMTGFIDPASRGRSQHDGEQLIELYRREGLTLMEADNAVEAGIFDVHQRMTSGRLRVFKTLVNWQKEFGVYHRDEQGKVVKKNDHALDATRYLCRAHAHLNYASEGHYTTNRSGIRYLTSRPRRHG
jgi:phage terminase large subunit-like protein